MKNFFISSSPQAAFLIMILYIQAFTNNKKKINLYYLTIIK